MKSKYKIAWQKYEDVLEKQFSSPIIMNFMKNIINNTSNETEENEEELTFDDDDEEDNIDDNKNLVMMPMSEELIKELSVVTNFDCWIAHTNFDITYAIKDKLNSMPGVEVLKIFSRYRFFIGIGRLFDFTEVRKNIEYEITPKED